MANVSITDSNGGIVMRGYNPYNLENTYIGSPGPSERAFIIN